MLQPTRRDRPAVATFLTLARDRGVVAAHQPRAAHRGLDDVFEALVTYRNRVLGHGAQRPAAFYAGLADAMLAAAAELAAEVEVSAEVAPLLVEHDGRTGVLDQVKRSSVAYLDYATGDTFEVSDTAAVHGLIGEPARRARQPGREVPHRLPRERDGFVGRARDVAELSERLVRHPLVTLTGMPGTGKTRLAVHAAWGVLGAFPGGAWFADLSDARDRSAILSKVAAALDVPLAENPETQLANALRGRGRCLVVLDNAEQVTGDVGELVGSWLDAAQEVAFLVTSRQVLGLPGEQVVSLDPLSAEHAIELFVERVRQRKRAFAITDANRDAVTGLVALLDGLPLAVELAAARAAVMPPAKLLARMKDRWKVLAGARGSRYATLRAAFDASWDALDAAEKAALAQASVFRGGFTLEAAEAVLDLPDDAWPMDVVQQLVDKSLLRVWASDGGDRFAIDEPHFGMVVSLREYADEQLRAPDRFESSGPVGTGAVELRHASHFAEYGSDATSAARKRVEGADERAALAHDLENVVVACERSVRMKRTDLATATCGAAASHLFGQGPIERALDLTAKVLALDLLAEERHDVLLTAAGGAMRAGRHEVATGHLEQAMSAARQLGPAREGAVLIGLGSLAVHQGQLDAGARLLEQGVPLGGQDEVYGLITLADAAWKQGRIADARRWLERGHTAALEEGDAGQLVYALNVHGCIDTADGKLADALDRQLAGLELARKLGDRAQEALLLTNIAGQYSRLRSFDDARRLLHEAVDLAHKVGWRWIEGHALGTLGDITWKAGRLQEAAGYIEQALIITRELNSIEEAWNLNCLGVVRGLQGNPDQARAHFAAGLVIARRFGDLRSESHILVNSADLGVDVGSDGAEALRAALAGARACGDRLFEAHVLIKIALRHVSADELVDARREFQSALELARAVEDRRLVASAMTGLSKLELASGDPEVALALASEAVGAMRELGAADALGHALVQSGRALMAFGRPEEARACFEEAGRIDDVRVVKAVNQELLALEEVVSLET